ncbi:hypothetical protein [Phenylobacterium sp.]|uniref:hypothetical protein n=1 Tax=Phenylobacterium sp. TaxID=1871053 RepID=UPI0027301623|nr:hypothetical protein [Phenylobacterium sp.]MDP1598973.1 hypothetical protein [Phenylobacterium sp.]MDP3590400.1 hypothetical protein [Phenylobacterium sp.]
MNPRIQVGPLTYAVQPAVAEEIRILREIVFTLAIASACLSQPTHSVRKALAQKWRAYWALVTAPATEEHLAQMQQW